MELKEEFNFYGSFCLSKIKIITVIGARPQFIKASSLSREIAKHNDIEEIIIHTGQHYDANMSNVFFEELEIPKPKYNLGIGGGTHGQNTGRMLEGIEKILIDEKPNYLLVYGDTDSTLAASLAASKLHISVIHIEAGLRSFNKKMPEELNRILTDHVSEYLFTPTETATKHLLNEGIKKDKIYQVGDIMYDTALYFGDKADKESKILDTLNLIEKDFYLVTVHRQENTDDKTRLENIFNGLNSLSSKNKIVLPLHPRTRKKLLEFGLDKLLNNLIITEPLGYLDMVKLEKNAKGIITDSGGIQKEAFFYGVPCFTLRDETEWVELVDIGVNKLIHNNENIYSQLINSKINEFNFNSNIYGLGNTSELIINELLSQD